MKLSTHSGQFGGPRIRQKLFVHIGFAKCASTSLQEALCNAHGILYPAAGRLPGQVEHISLPMYLKGIDTFRRQWITDEWVAREHPKLMREISRSNAPVAVSSELLAALQPNQIERMAELFSSCDTQIVVLYRDRESYLRSTWRHVVYHHDYAIDYATFRGLHTAFRFDETIRRFEAHFPVSAFNIDEPGVDANIMELTGATFALDRANVGVPFELAELLQQQHVRLGSKVFKSVFTPALKAEMRANWTSQTPPPIDPYTGPTF